MTTPVLTQAQLLNVLLELHALARAQHVIASRTDLAEAFTWQCVAEAVRERREKLLANAETLLGETVSRDTGAGITEQTEPIDPLDTDDGPWPPRRVH